MIWTTEAEATVEAYCSHPRRSNPEIRRQLVERTENEARHWNADIGIVDKDCVLLALGSIHTDFWDR